MFSILEQEEIQREIQNSAAMDLVGMYLQEENRKIYEEVHKGILEKYPSLEGIIGEQVQNSNPTEILETIREREKSALEAKIELEKKSKKLIIVGLAIRLLWGINLQEYMQRYTTAYRGLHSALESSLEFYEEYFANLSINIRKVAKEKNMTEEKVVSSQDLRDLVYRRAYPTREAAEEIEKIEEKHIIAIRDYFKTIINVTEELRKKIPGLAQQNSEEKDNIPEMKEWVEKTELYLRVAAPKIKEYNKKRLDRIYGARE